MKKKVILRWIVYGEPIKMFKTKKELLENMKGKEPFMYGKMQPTPAYEDC